MTTQPKYTIEGSKFRIKKDIDATKLANQLYRATVVKQEDKRTVHPYDLITVHCSKWGPTDYTVQQFIQNTLNTY